MAKDFVVTNALRNIYANAIADAPDDGASNGVIRIFDSDGVGGGTLIPTNPEDPDVGSELVPIPLADPAFGGALDGVVSLNSPPGPGTAIATGVADYFRVYDSNDVCKYQGTAGESADSPDMELTNKNISVNDEITINSMQITVARSVGTLPP